MTPSPDNTLLAELPCVRTQLCESLLYERHGPDCPAHFSPAIAAALQAKDDSHAKEIADRDARIARLEEALRPFAKAADIKLCGEWRDDERFGQTDVSFYLTFGDLRKARAALQTDEAKP